MLTRPSESWLGASSGLLFIGLAGAILGESLHMTQQTLLLTSLLIARIV